jgi:hypothetical protein
MAAAPQQQRYRSRRALLCIVRAAGWSTLTSRATTCGVNVRRVWSNGTGRVTEPCAARVRRLSSQPDALL